MERSSSQYSSNNIVSRILQLALGLFVTTSDLPSYPSNREHLTYDCSFDSDCRWASVGGKMDHWKVARGEPDSLLWLAATGTTQLPREPYVLIEQRGFPVDALMTDEISCHRGTADLSFVYWAIGSADLEICLTDVEGDKLNCTGMLRSSVMPGKANLNVPSTHKPFRVCMNFLFCVCKLQLCRVRLPHSRYTPHRESELLILSISSMTVDVPFELMVHGNKTSPMFDRRTGMVISDSAKLLCDFNNDFACQWGAEIGRWAIIEKGPGDQRLFSCAIPSLEESVADQVLLPSYPAALVLQGPVLLASDPIRCQTGPGKLMFRYWSNGDILLQTCLIDYGSERRLIECVDQSTTTGKESHIAVFDFIKSIKEPFTLNLIPQWTRGVKNRFLVIDEIAYIGECSDMDSNHNSTVASELQSTTIHAATVTTQWIPSHASKQEKIQENYCNSLNCNFDEDSCNYLNHGLTKKPWTLRNRGYGYPLTAKTDIRPVSPNGQFVSTILDPGDIAILESPKINATRSLNVLLFQYFRPSQMTTIRLCLGSRYTVTLTDVAEFTRCPSILQPLTSVNMLRWNTIHVQLPPGTTQFFIVAHNSEQSDTRVAVGLDNTRVAVCYPRGVAPDHYDEVEDE
ncbi:unnamed protein product [Angiostrongylus costaricensis]|uniref:MAM domain-containing protein n=1 Tax=Angiostrongylus costaricensis TaxID=334426 RepID=A0A0R3PLD4_ANGCS|nr:unnamed protein product [Angiostrongylus costaricensis]